MLNPGGRSLIETIFDALLYLGVDISRPSHLPEMTPEEKCRRRRKLRRKAHHRRQLQGQREAER